MSQISQLNLTQADISQQTEQHFLNFYSLHDCKEQVTIVYNLFFPVKYYPDTIAVLYECHICIELAITTVLNFNVPGWSHSSASDFAWVNVSTRRQEKNILFLVDEALI